MVRMRVRECTFQTITFISRVRASLPASAARRCLVVDYKRIHYPLYKINHDERQRKKEGEKPRYKRFERESPIASPIIFITK